MPAGIVGGQRDEGGCYQRACALFHESTYVGRAGPLLRGLTKRSDKPRPQLRVGCRDLADAADGGVIEQQIGMVRGKSPDGCFDAPKISADSLTLLKGAYEIKGQQHSCGQAQGLPKARPVFPTWLT
jgi:hypothetical protein